MPGGEKKQIYFAKLKGLLKEYSSILLVTCDNVGSRQIQEIRIALRGQGIMLFGKNTMVRKALRDMSEEQPELEKLIPEIRGNVGFVFTNGDLKDVRSNVVKNRVSAPAKAGALAPDDVMIPAGNTGMEPGKTSFFQALGIPTKITKGTIEIVSDVHLIKEGSKVGASEAMLLNMMNISPFTYGLSVVKVYDNGTMFDPEILDVEESALIENLLTGIKRIAALSLATGIPTVAAVPHSLVNGYKKLLAIALVTECSFPAADKVIHFLFPNSQNYIKSIPILGKDEQNIVELETAWCFYSNSLRKKWL